MQSKQECKKGSAAITRGIYTAASGMLADEAAQNIIAQNLANADTTGYKRDILQFQSFAQTMLNNSQGTPGNIIGSLGTGAAIKGVATDLSSGALQQTNNPFDIALTGNAFLAIQTPQGVFYSRDGALTRDTQGDLIQAASGGAVLDTTGNKITIPLKAKDVTITPLGNVEADGAVVGQLRLVSLSPSLGAVKVGGNLFQQANPAPASADARVHQGYLEASNVNIVRELVAMITVQRAFETDQKMAQAEDNATNKAVNDVPKL